MAMNADEKPALPKSAGFAKPPFISNISVLPETPFYTHEIPPGYIDATEALNAYHAHCLAYEINKQGRSIILSMSEFRSYFENKFVPSFHVGPLMKVRNLHATDWHADGLILKQLFHEAYITQTFDVDLEYRTVIHRNVWVSYIKIINEEDNVIGGQVVLLIDDLLKIINSRDSATDSEDPETAEEVFISKGGRPAQHDSDLFLIEAFRIAYLDGAPKSQAELMERTSRAYQGARRMSHNSNRPPGETWMKERIRPIWKIIEEGRKGAQTS